MKDNRKIIQVLTILTIIFTIMGGSLAYWTWQSDSSTKVTFSVGSNFSCSVDGGGNINQTSANEYIAPATCTNEDYAIKRKVVVTPSISKDDLTISMDLWLDIDNLGTGLSDSYNFKYVLSTSDNSCDDSGVVSSGTFHGKKKDDTVLLLNGKTFTGTSATSQTYWLYIWLDKEETSSSTMNQPFSLSLNGSCTDNPNNTPEAPVLDAAMIPVTIADNGDVTTVSADSDSWYNYSSKRWANIVLVNEEATSGVEGSQSREYYLNNLSKNVPVAEEDILAYYVWIPRYKYRIPSLTLCGELENPTPKKYPNCYDGPYSGMSDEDKVMLYYYSLRYDYPEYTVDWDNEIDSALNTGYFSDGTSLLSLVADYNSNDDGYEFESQGEYYTKSNDIILTGGTFVADRIYGKTTTPGSIDIAFESSTDAIVKGDAVETYYSHPGFVYNGETLSGIWVSKFEIPIDLITLEDEDGDGYCVDETCLSDCSHYYLMVNKVIPNYNTVSSSYYSYEYISNTTNGCKSIASSGNVFGLNSSSINSHTSTNSEWGAIAYLAHSEYGINSNIENNNTMITGGGTYGQLTSYPQSTTGNISGIFDMFGGNNEDAGGDPSCDDGVCYGKALYETNGWYNGYVSLNYNSDQDFEEGSGLCVRNGLFGISCFYTQMTLESVDASYFGTDRAVLINGFAN